MKRSTNQFPSVSQLLMLLLACFLGWQTVYAQTGDQSAKDKTGVFGALAGLNVKAGLFFGATHSFKPGYDYILQQNARVIETQQSKDGSTLSVFALVPFDDQGAYNLVVSLALKDFKNLNTDANSGFLNSSTPFGLGFSCFPFPKARFFGFSVVGSVGQQNRMRADAIANTFFPIADHADYKLAVAAPVPDGLLSPYFYRETTYSVSFGLTLRI